MTACDPRLFIPASVSDAARAVMAPLGAIFASMPARAIPVTIAEFDDAAAASAAFQKDFTASKVDLLEPAIAKSDIGGVPVIALTPKGWRDDGTTLVYVHGGGFVQGSAQSCLLLAALMAERTGRRVVSIDYTLSPRADFNAISDQITCVYTAMLASAWPDAIGLFGESAGGAIVAGTVHKLQARGIALPAGLVLMSPVTELACTGDTHVTLAPYEFIGAAQLRAAYQAYAPGAAASDPVASPLLGDFTAGFPPTLIQVGTRERLLSDSVRLYRAIRTAGGTATLDVYDGMPHVFQQMVPDAPEGLQAWAEITQFWDRWLPSR